MQAQRIENAHFSLAKYCRLSRRNSNEKIQVIWCGWKKHNTLSHIILLNICILQFFSRSPAFDELSEKNGAAVFWWNSLQVTLGRQYCSLRTYSSVLSVASNHGIPVGMNDSSSLLSGRQVIPSGHTVSAQEQTLKSCICERKAVLFPSPRAQASNHIDDKNLTGLMKQRGTQAQRWSVELFAQQRMGRCTSEGGFVTCAGSQHGEENDWHCRNSRALHFFCQKSQQGLSLPCLAGSLADRAADPFPLYRGIWPIFPPSSGR